MIRTWLYYTGTSTAKNLHDRAVTFVSARAQAVAADKILSRLDEEEISVYKRGRNANANTIPKGSTQEEYHIATGFEALFGYLYINGRIDRLNELFTYVVEEN